MDQRQANGRKREDEMFLALERMSKCNWKYCTCSPQGETDSNWKRAWTDGHSYPGSVIHLRSFPWQTRPSICCFWLEITLRARAANGGPVQREGFLANVRGNRHRLAAILLCLKAVSSSRQHGQRKKSTADCVKRRFRTLVLTLHIYAKPLNHLNNQLAILMKPMNPLTWL